MSKEKIKDIAIKFCEMMIEKEEEVKSIRVRISLKDKSKINFKKFRDGK